MSLQFIIGGAGSGKTRFMYEQAISESAQNPELHCLIVVPEQYTMQTQREIIRLHPKHGIMKIDILSFKRLAYRVFEDLGVQLPPILDDMGKSMVVRRVAAQKRRKLGLYGRHLEQTGFISQLKSQISELYQYGLTPEDLRRASQEASHPLLSQKLEDLEVIYEGFRDYIQSHYVTTEELLDILCRELPRWKPLKNSVIFLDGFTGFTPVQYRLAELFLLHGKRVLCSATVDPRVNPYKECSIQHLFYMSRHTVYRLCKMAARHHVERKKDIILEGRPGIRFADRPELDFLEQNLYRYYGKTWEKPQDSIHIYRGKNPADEAAFVVSCIRRMVQEYGFRYRDAAVITGDLSSYGRELSHQFDENKIPYFLDDKKSILENPLVELIRAALETVKDFSYESVFRYLKTGLVYDWSQAEEGGTKENGAEEGPAETGAFDASRERVIQLTDRMENYVRALGIRGFQKWDSRWERQYRGGEKLNLKELNEYRLWVLGPLKKLRQAFKEEGATIATVTAALREFLEDMKLREKLELYRDAFLERGKPKDQNLAREYGQVFDRTLELFDRLEGLLGDEKADMKNYIQILDAGFSEIQVGLLPATVDQVVVGDITRSRLEDVKVLFFIGVNEGIVPQRKAGGGILTDYDREVLRSLDVELSPTAKEDGCIQKFYLYLMLSKPSKSLVLTYGSSSADGKGQRPSSLIGEVKKLFPELQEIDDRTLKKRVLTVRDGREYLIEGLRILRQKLEKEEEWGKNPEFYELYRYFYQMDTEREQVRKLVDAAFYSYEEKGIGRAAARALYGNILQGSVTRLEQYASCAYAHFLKYGLELMERQEYELEAVDMGNLFHQSIDQCFAAMEEQELDWGELTDERRSCLVKECVARVTAEYGNTIMSSSARNAYLATRVERITDRTIWALSEQVKKGDFKPAAFELSFSAADNLKAMQIFLSEEEELHLKGRIDRMDLYEDEGCVYVKIIDYKSGSTSFDLAALYYGLQLQLVVYMDAALELEERRHSGKKAVPAGIFYYHIKDPMAEKKEGMTPEDAKQEILRQLRMNGLVNSELDIISHLDREIQKESDVIPVAIKNGYVQESRSSVATTARFEALRGFVNQKLKKSGQDILKGNTDRKPYKQGDRTACDYCPYHAVCGFDTKTAGFGYRRLKNLKPEEIWQEIEEEKEEGQDGGEMDSLPAEGN